MPRNAPRPTCAWTEFANAWRGLITADHHVGRAYALHLIERIELHDENAVIIGKQTNLRRAGVRVFSVSQDLPDDPMGELTASSIGVTTRAFRPGAADVSAAAAHGSARKTGHP